MSSSKPTAPQRLFRKITGTLLLIVGIPLYILPIPLGLPLLIAGSTLLLSASYGARRWAVRFGRRFPALWKRIRTFLRRRSTQAQPNSTEDQDHKRAA